MTAIDPTPASFKALFTHVPADTVIVMLNLLRYREQAAYSAERSDLPCSGREAYARYSAATLPLLAGVGAEVIWHGTAKQTVIAPAGEVWDDVVMVRYPSTAAFGQMVKSEAYQAITYHRQAALADARLIATVPSHRD